MIESLSKSDREKTDVGKGLCNLMQLFFFSLELIILFLRNDRFAAFGSKNPYLIQDSFVFLIQKLSKCGVILI